MAVSASPGARRRLEKRVIVETPNPTLRRAKIFEFCEISH